MHFLSGTFSYWNQSYYSGTTTQVPFPLRVCLIECYLFQVFMRNSVFEPLEVRRFEFLTLNALFIQKIWRGFHCRKGTYMQHVIQVGKVRTGNRYRLNRGPRTSQAEHSYLSLLFITKILMQ